ncbi:hypothetical protein BSR29_07390 [Boudabousia liubingyangii]|uniref:Acid phosphatase n=1 Tax=Boudabousia liubingyangii TaxID=1921764 RepID=A0A1Q5PK81_9ACTO|nr:HAD family acid phosphatase [Boudabousia liubingyangii]OKL46635.1 hypothetical protein BSR29_07390 [Boudabousia liubingyangii]
MIPEYCVPDLAHTGASGIFLFTLAFTLLLVGAFFVSGHRRAGRAAAAALLLLPLGMTNLPSAEANDNVAQKSCPAGYHYDASRDHAKPAPKPGEVAAPPAAGKTPEASTPETKTPETKTPEATAPEGPALTVATPATVLRGQQLPVTINGVKAGDQVKVYLAVDPSVAVTVKAQQNGALVANLDLAADMLPGTYQVLAHVDDRTASATTQVQRNPQVERQAGADLGPNVKFTVSDRGLDAKDGTKIVNWDIAKATVRAYYGYDKKTHTSDLENSPYAQQMAKLSDKWAAEVAANCKAAVAKGEKPAAVFDSDDTTLYGINFEEAINYAFTPAKQQAYFDGKTATDASGRTYDFTNPEGGPNYMPATPGMIKVVKAAKENGCTIFGLTGRSANQADYSVENLKRAGYVDAAGQPLFTKANYFTNSGKLIQGYGEEAGQPQYDLGKDGLGFCTTRGTKCQTVEYKAGTRQHLMDQGYRIVGSFGDQWSDLQGGRADHTYKLPNPAYYLPDRVFQAKAEPTYTGDHPLAGWEAKNRAEGMAPAQVTYPSVAPDGSSGRAPGVQGDQLPNMDVVKANIRNYYNGGGNRDLKVPTGIADKEASNYIQQMKQITATKGQEVLNSCRAAKAKGLKPAVVFDSDDTTLFTYDMEDYGMSFAFTPALQDAFFFAKAPFEGELKFPAPYQSGSQAQLDGKKVNYLPASPAMVEYVKSVKEAGCQVVGLTGRHEDQAAYSVANLAAAGYVDADGKPLFTADLYFTKPHTFPKYLDSFCAADIAKKGKCSTISFKSGTRAHVENDLGYTIVGNFGDQFSDLKGGFSEAAVKLPNATYYLP